MRLLLDTNILLRLTDPGHSSFDTAKQAIELLQSQGYELRTVPQNLYEFWVVATRPITSNGLEFSPEQAAHHCGKIRRLFPLLRDERLIVDLWSELVITHNVLGRNAHDARLVAAMQRHGLTQLLTFNADDFKRFSAITVLTPEFVIAEGTG
jgi:predicted nucleic acid-binding protein